jgi:hypothetical protein
MREKARRVYLEQARRDRVTFPKPAVTRHVDEQYELVWLPDSLALVEEAMAMKHCVSDYVDLCRDGASIIYSVRTGAGERLATLEIDVHGEIQQLVGPANTPCRRDVKRWVVTALKRVAASRAK